MTEKIKVDTGSEPLERSRLAEKLRQNGFIKGLSLLSHTPEEALEGPQTKETFNALLEAMGPQIEGIDTTKLLPENDRIEDIPEGLKRNDELAIMAACDGISSVKSYLKYVLPELSPEELLKMKIERFIDRNNQIFANVQTQNYTMVSSEEEDRNLHIISPPIILPPPFNDGYEVLIARFGEQNRYIFYIIKKEHIKELQKAQEEAIAQTTQDIRQAEKTLRVSLDELISPQPDADKDGDFIICTLKGNPDDPGSVVLVDLEKLRALKKED